MKKQKKKRSLILYAVSALLICLSIAIVCICVWVSENFVFGLKEMLYTLTGSLDGTNTDMVRDGVRACVPVMLPLMLVIIFCFALDYKYQFRVRIKGKLFGKKCRFDFMKGFRKYMVLFSMLCLVGAIWYVEQSFKIIEFLGYQTEVSTIYEDSYVDPETVQIVAPEQKKNLVYIYMESMENTYQLKVDGGVQDENLVPNLVSMAKDPNNVSFSDDELIGGFRPVEGTTWTVAALFASSSGVPFSFPVQQNAMSNFREFAPGITTMGDILKDNGYNQEFICGSEATYGGRANLFTQHGDYRIFDLFTARTEGYIAPDYKVWWGYEDMYLYEIAKDEITRLSEEEEPFNVTLLTVDTHFPEGYRCALCDKNTATKTGDIVSCADRQINDFILWLQEQPFYEDTVIVISGDHPRMDTHLVKAEKDFLNRTMYNCFINASVAADDVLKTKNRTFTSMDMFPTVLSAMGFQIEGDRLGLGTNMFSGKPTLAEEMGIVELQTELSKQSEYYVEKFMYNRLPAPAKRSIDKIR